MQDRDLLDLLDLSFASEEGLHAYLDRVLERCARWFGAGGASIFLQASERTYTPVARSGTETRGNTEAIIERGVGIAGTCIEKKQPLLVNDPSQHPLLAGKVAYQRKESYSAMIVPLVMPSGDVIGVLNVSRQIKDKPFNEKDLRLAKTLGNQIALAVSNARLVDSLNESLEQSRRLQRKLQAIIDHAGVAILVADHGGRITETNRAALELSGTGAPSDYAQYLQSLPRGLREAVHDAFEVAASGDEEHERAFDKISGRSWSVVSSPMPDGGITLIINEVTEQERAIKELDRVRRLAEIGQMTAAIAHEIRNPLASICSAAQFVQTEPETAHEFGAIIEHEALKLNDLCDEFLNFAKPLELDLRPVRLNQLVNAVATSHVVEFQRADVMLEVETDDHDPIVMADPLRLEQACRNLLLNALQACMPGGVVRVIVDGSGFMVEDTGHGMEAATAEKLFTPFFTTKPKGTGLGLSNVKKIVDAHRGSIDLTSAPRQGTRFSVRLEQKSA